MMFSRYLQLYRAYGNRRAQLSQLSFTRNIEASECWHHWACETYWNVSNKFAWKALFKLTPGAQSKEPSAKINCFLSLLLLLPLTLPLVILIWPFVSGECVLRLHWIPLNENPTVTFNLCEFRLLFSSPQFACRCKSTVIWQCLCRRFEGKR